MAMHCTCYSGTSAAINGQSKTTGGTTYNFTCKKTYSTLGADTSSDDYNQFVKVYFSEGSTGDKSVGLKLRPRKGDKCLVGVYDGNEKKLWTGAYCDTSDEKKFDPFPLKFSSGTDGTAGAQYMVGGAAITGTSTKNTLLGIYLLDSAGKYNIIAGCVEDN